MLKAALEIALPQPLTLIGGLVSTLASVLTLGRQTPLPAAEQEGQHRLAR